MQPDIKAACEELRVCLKELATAQAAKSLERERYWQARTVKAIEILEETENSKKLVGGIR